MKKRLIRSLKSVVRLVVLVGVGLAAWYAYESNAPAAEENGLGELPVVVAEIRDITVSVEATGVLRPIKVVEIKSKAAGEILDMPVDMGDFVEVGDLIAQIDTQILDQELRQVRADYETALVRLNIARNQLQRAQSLYAEDLIAENELESSQQGYANAEAQKQRSEASLDLAKERLEDATVRAPRSGTIIEKTVEEGQIISSSINSVSGGTTLVKMADLSVLEIRTLVDEVDIGQVRAGLSVDSKVEAFPDRRFAGEVVNIEPQAVLQQSVTTFPVLSRIENASRKLLPGMNADVSVIVHSKPDVLTIPNEAVRTARDAAEVVGMLGLAEVETSGGGGERGGGGDDEGGNVGDRGGSGAATSRVSGDSRARFESMSPAQRQRMVAAMRDAASEADRDPFGVEGRRENAVVFVYDRLGAISTRNIVVGMRDWEHTEVIDGLDRGDQVLVLPSSSLLRSQEQIRAWARGRSGIPGARRSSGPPPWVRGR